MWDKASDGNNIAGDQRATKVKRVKVKVFDIVGTRNLHHSTPLQQLVTNTRENDMGTRFRLEANDRSSRQKKAWKDNEVGLSILLNVLSNVASLTSILNSCKFSDWRK
jgi:hypothetical protein